MPERCDVTARSQLEGSPPTMPNTGFAVSLATGRRKSVIVRVYVRPGDGAVLPPLLRHQGLLTRDLRAKERKEYGQKGTLKKFQWTERELATRSAK